RSSDQLLRRISWLPLASLEPIEVEAALSVPHRLAIADISDRVLAAVGRDLPQAALYHIDLSAAPLPFKADGILAFNVFCRIDRGGIAMQNLLAGLRPGGLLLADDRSTSRFLPQDQFERVAEKTHRRRPSSRHE